MALSQYIVEAAIYGGLLGFFTMAGSCALGFAGAALYYVFGW